MTQTADYPAGVVASGARGCTLTCAHRQIGLRQGASREIVVHADQPDLYASADQRFEAAGRAGRRHYAPSPSPGPITYREWEQPDATQSADSAPRRVVSGRAGVACKSSSYGRPRHLRTIGPGEGRSGLLSTPGRFDAAQPVGVGDLDLSPRGWKPRDAHLGRASGSAPVS
jgi:hypothetical protein